MAIFGGEAGGLALVNVEGKVLFHPVSFSPSAQPVGHLRYQPFCLVSHLVLQAPPPQTELHKEVDS